MSLRLLICAVVAGLLAVATPAASAAPALPLGHAGRFVTDAQGRVVILHGYNMVYKRPPYAPDATGFGDDDAAFLAAEGYNTVRVGVIYKAVEPSPGVYDDAYLARIASTVDTLGRHGIVSMLDFHQDLYNEAFQGEGWPDWAVQDDGLPHEPKSGFPNNYLVMPALQRAFDHFWNNDPGPGGVGLQDRYAAAWRHVAQRFGSNRSLLGYELMNEPWPGSAWQPCANPATGCPAFDSTLTAFANRSTAAIRQVDRRTLVFYEPAVLFNFGAPTSTGPLGDPRGAFAFHDYCLSPGPSGHDSSCDTFDDTVFANAASHATRTGEPNLLTEFGATDDAILLGKMVARADRNMVGWQEWHYCGCSDPTTSGPGDTQAIVLDPSRPPTGSNVKSAKLAILSRPYPQAVAGTPESFGFDPDAHRFDLRYRTTRAGGGALASGALTEIALPARQYPRGYDVAVEGGSVRSRPGAATLQIAACAGAGEVGVNVTPGTGRVRQTCTPPPPVGAAAIHLSASPRSARAGRRVRFVFLARARVNGRLRPVAGARIRFAGRNARTNRRGRAVIVKRFGASRRGRRYTARAFRRDLRTGRVVVTVRASRRR
jgi:endoglycosylceramidase